MNAENKLSLLWDFGAELHKVHDKKKLIQYCADTVSKLVNADRSSIFLYNKEENELWTVHAEGLNEEIRVPANQSVVGHAATTKEIQVVVDAYNDFRFFHKTDQSTGYQTHNILAIPLEDSQGDVLGVVEVINKLETIFSPDDVKAVTLLGEFISYVLENQLFNEAMESKVNKRVEEIKTLNKKLQHKVEELTFVSEHDKLTKIYNRVKIDTVVNDIFKKWNQTLHIFSIVLFDIDDFKLVNDRYGHFVGDQVLCALTERMKAHLPKHAFFGRWGGEEFILLLPGMDNQKSYALTSTLRQSLNTPLNKEAGIISCSFGIATIRKSDSIASLFKRVDEAMYAAKTCGKNCIRADQ
jgi:diguanylate cyclase (GGDEF)-like protein